MLFAQGLIIEVQHRYRTVITGVESRIQRTLAGRALFNRDVGLAAFPGDESLAVAAENPQTGGGEVIA